MSLGLLEQHIFSKPYFDRHGLLVAEDQGTLVGFAHAAFGPTNDLNDISTANGMTCLLMTSPHADQQQTRQALLNASETHLRLRGAQQIFAGSVWPMTPFYLGLYGGSGIPGVLTSDRTLDDLYLQAGYQAIRSSEVWQRELTGFRSRVDRRSMQIRREYVIETAQDGPCSQWWTACVLSQSFYVRFQLIPKAGGQPVASATFWDMEPLASGWGVRAMGMVELEVVPHLQRQGLGCFLLGEVLRQLQSEGIHLVECQAPDDNPAARGLFQSLGFQVVDRGTWYQKSAVS